MIAESLREEIESAVWLFEEVRAGNRLPVQEAGVVVHCLHAAMRSDGSGAPPVIAADTEETYLPVNAVNVAFTAMAAAQALKLEPEGIRAVGMAGLLHDIGMVRIPSELLNKNEQLSDEDRDMLMRHPAQGAAIIVEAESAPDIVAVAAYEHHLRPGGGGYPTLTYPRSAHLVSRLIAVCSGYHALTSERPFRRAWTPADALTILESASGRDYDREMVRVLVSLLRNGDDKTPQGI
jgi:HD-GYP domain-containing protein (c-di-GMP phosphodiesterase class II)